MSRVIIQAGGEGTRLRPFTTVLPKPLMPVDGHSILEIMVRQFVSQGFSDITVTLGHLGHLIMAVIGDGQQWDAKIRYVWEKKPLGTIGAVTLIDDLDQTFLVTNGDLLTDFDYRAFTKDHRESKAALSVAVYQKTVPVSLGVCDVSHRRLITGFREKPTLVLPCSMGIYAFEPELLRLIPRERNFGFDDLMALCLSRDICVRAHPFEGVWMDLGRPEDYSSANEIFVEKPSLFLENA